MLYYFGGRSRHKARFNESVTALDSLSLSHQVRALSGHAAPPLKGAAPQKALDVTTTVGNLPPRDV